MKRRSLKLLGLTSLLFSLWSVPSLLAEKDTLKVEAAYSPSVTYTNHDADDYYCSITSSMVGQDLLTKLQNINTARRKTKIGYSGMGTSGSGAYCYTDYDTTNVQYDKNNQPYSTTISSFYTYAKTTSFNREHVWPDTHGGGKVEDDIHMTRPTINSENSSRGCSYFVDGMNTKNNTGWDPGAAGYSENSRGEAARIIFYCCVATDQLSLEVGNANSSKSNTVKMGDLVTLMKWNVDYPVTEREKNRNEGAEYLQGNRNPFIDHPSYAVRIWGELFKNNSEIQAICARANFDDDEGGGGGTTTTAPTLAIKNGSTDVTGGTVNLKVGESASLSAVVNGSTNSSVTWEMSGSSAVGNKSADGKFNVIGTAKGDSTVTAKIAYADAGTTKYVSKQVTIKVTETSTGGGGGGGTIIDGNLVAVTATSQLENGDVIVLKTDEDAGAVLSGTAQSTSSNKETWTQFEVVISGGQVKLKNLSTNQYIASVSKNAYQEDDTGVAITVDSNGLLYQGTRVLCINGSYVRFYSSLGSYTALRVYKLVPDVPPTVKTLESLSLTGTCKDEYDINDDFDPTGLTVTASYSDGSSENVTADVVWTYDLSLAGERTIVGTFSFEGVAKIVTLTVNVKEEVPPIIDDHDDNDNPPASDDEKEQGIIDGILDKIPGMDLLDKFGLGCSGDLSTTSIIIFASSVLGVALICFFKKREKQK